LRCDPGVDGRWLKGYHTLMNPLESAIALAVEAHRGQLDKSGRPYILHPLRVMFRCTTDLERTVAVLHDVVEDTGRTFDDLRRLGFSEEVIAALDGVTKREGSRTSNLSTGPRRTRRRGR
jgi:(p)ppGpp synthase/HD superfamily hydrolase